MAGSSRRVSRVKAIRPSATSSRLITVASTGRLIDRSEILMPRASPPAPSRRRLRLHDPHLRANKDQVDDFMVGRPGAIDAHWDAVKHESNHR